MSDKTKWTPGPWNVNKVGDYSWDVKGGGWSIASASALLRAGGVTEGRANAHLIAAAPDLYEALEFLLDCAEEVGMHRMGAASSMAEARAALAKARGES